MSYEVKAALMNAQVFSLRNLVIFLDGARPVYRDAVREVIRPYLSQWFEWVVDAPLMLTHNLDGKVDRLGGTVARDGMCVTALRLRGAAWRVRISLDAQTGYAMTAARRETRAQRGFRSAERAVIQIPGCVITSRAISAKSNGWAGASPTWLPCSGCRQCRCPSR